MAYFRNFTNRISIIDKKILQINWITASSPLVTVKKRWKDVLRKKKLNKSKLLFTSFFKGHDRVVTIKSRNFSIAKVCVVWVYIDLPGVVIWQHIQNIFNFLYPANLTVRSLSEKYNFRTQFVLCPFFSLFSCIMFLLGQPNLTKRATFLSEMESKMV